MCACQKQGYACQRHGCSCWGEQGRSGCMQHVTLSVRGARARAFECLHRPRYASTKGVRGMRAMPDSAHTHCE